MARIPKILHYCFGFKENFGGRPWALSHYVCLKSAVERIKPDVTYLYYEHEPSGPWWDATLPLVTPIQMQAPREVFGNPVDHPAHRADVVRLRKLLEHGGIYLDADVLVQRSFDDLLDHSVVMGAEGRGLAWGVANAVIAAEPNAPFISKWYEEYRSFRGQGKKYWNEHSVKLPLKMSRKFPDEITVLPYDAFFWPLWTEDHMHWIFESTRPISLANTYANHLWEQKASQYFAGLTPGEVRSVDTNFHLWARPLLEGLPNDYGGDAERPASRRTPPLTHLAGLAKMYARQTKHILEHMIHADR